ncbi:DUF72 domain-containing protein [Candidatus Binatia bacterium]|nr:DUF72 domain-containing protein [Candidatus Binatia bacterium]
MNTPAAEPRFRVGTASWTDPTLLAASFYPPEARTAERRLRFYAAHFDTVEVDSTYYALPSERNSILWAARTPDDFRFSIKAFAFLTQHAAETRALPQALRASLPADALAQPRIERPPPEVSDLAFDMFRSALVPLDRAGKLGCVLLQFPPWFAATPAHEAYLDLCRAKLPGYRLAVEFRHRSWFGPRAERTRAFLAERDLVLVCLDAPAAPSIPLAPFVTTTDIAYVRLHGRNREAWFARHRSAAERFKYLYSDRELRECAEQIRRLDRARTIYVLFNNCYADYGVRNAATMRGLLAGDALGTA